MRAISVRLRAVLAAIVPAAAIGAAAAIVGAAATIGTGTSIALAPALGSADHDSSRTHVSFGRLRAVLSGDGIGRVRFGASPHAVRTAIDALLGQAGGPYRRGGSCLVDHQITWWDQWAADGEPTFVVYFAQGRLAGYQYGTYRNWIVRGLPDRGPVLATTRGLTIGDTLARGRRLYGRPFRLSEAQGGTWLLTTPRGGIDGYAWGMPKQGDISLQSVVATIDAGNVGCPAASP